MESLTFLEKIEAIARWQECEEVHSLTCGDCGKDLFPCVVDKQVILNCKCGYTQNYIPDVVFKRYVSRNK